MKHIKTLRNQVMRSTCQRMYAFSHCMLNLKVTLMDESKILTIYGADLRRFTTEVFLNFILPSLKGFKI